MLTEKKIAEIYDLHSRELFIFIVRLVHVREAAEDLLHDCFVNLMRYSQKYEIKEETIRPFLYKTAYNLSLNYLKRGDRNSGRSLEDVPEAAASDDVVAGLELRELHQRINELLESLDERGRAIFLMKRDLNLTYEEIALNLGISERSVRRRLAEVLTVLARELKKSGYGEKFLMFLTIFLG